MLSITNGASLTPLPELVQVYDRASGENQRKLQALISLWLRDMEASNAASLSNLMDKISDRAAQRGLTPEILDLELYPTAIQIG